ETGWFTADDYNITISLGLSAPLYDAGSLEAKIKQAKNELAKVLVQIEYAYQNLSNILIQMQLKCEVNKAKIEYYLSKIQADNEIIKLKENVFNEGELNEVDFLKFKSNLYTDLISLYLEAIDYYTNYFSIEAICGIELN
ncbi:MAG: TolC family protein, partial [Exilispira sp.]